MGCTRRCGRRCAWPPAGRRFARRRAPWRGAWLPSRYQRCRVCDVDGFLALRESAACAPLQALADECMLRTEAHRAPPGMAELARRRAGGLSARQDALLQAYGYPYVLDEWGFSMSRCRAGLPAPRWHGCARWRRRISRPCWAERGSLKTFASAFRMRETSLLPRAFAWDCRRHLRRRGTGYDESVVDPDRFGHCCRRSANRVCISRTARWRHLQMDWKQSWQWVRWPTWQSSSTSRQTDPPERSDAKPTIRSLFASFSSEKEEASLVSVEGKSWGE